MISKSYKTYSLFSWFSTVLPCSLFLLKLESFGSKPIHLSIRIQARLKPWSPHSTFWTLRNIFWIIFPLCHTILLIQLTWKPQVMQTHFLATTHEHLYFYRCLYRPFIYDQWSNFRGCFNRQAIWFYIIETTKRLLTVYWVLPTNHLVQLET